MDLNILKVLEIVVQKYSRKPARDLINHQLHLKFVVRILPSLTSPLSSLASLSPSETAVFQRKSRDPKSRYVTALCISHPLKISITELLLQEI